MGSICIILLYYVFDTFWHSHRCIQAVQEEDEPNPLPAYKCADFEANFGGGALATGGLLFIM